ncbi:MAG: phosphatidylglycerol lysyltransferase domain-containing protein, partial [Clostridia bacterium]
PYGAGKFCAAISAIREDAERMGNTPCMVAVTDAMRDKLEICHHGEFSYTETRDTFDYIYSTEDLITLAGRKFSQKRNHINKFLSLYDGRYGYEDITAENLPEVAEFQARWVKENSTDENAAGLAHEMVAINRAFEHFFEIGLIGGIVRVDGDIAAYSLGTPLGD